MYKRKSRHVRVTNFALESNKYYYSECVTLVTQHARRIVICGLPDSTIPPPPKKNDLIKGTTLRGKNNYCIQNVCKNVV